MKTLSLKAIINSLGFVRKTVTIQLKVIKRYSIFYKKAKYKINKGIRNNYLSAKNICKINCADVKSVITEHPNTFHNFCKTLREAEKVVYNSSLYRDTKKSKN